MPWDECKPSPWAAAASRQEIRRFLSVSCINLSSFDTSAYTLAGEASGRRAVRLAPGRLLEFTLTRPANALTIRYSIPDAPGGGGIEAPLELTANGKRPRTLTLTSRYAWLYNQYPFSNDPNADLLHPDWWVTECACVPAFTTPAPTFPKPFRPTHFYDEQRVLLERRYDAGDTVRFTVPERTNAAWTIVDVVDFQEVAKPGRRPRRSISVVEYGADRTGRKDSADAFDTAVAAAKAAGRTVWIPAGTYQVNRHIVVDDVTIEGAGSWYSVVQGREVTLPAPLPDGSVHTGVGFYGGYAADGGSSDVRLCDHARGRVGREGPLLDRERPLPGRARGRDRHLGRERPGGRLCVVREHRRAQPRRGGHQQLRVVPLHAGWVGVVGGRPRRQRQQRHESRGSVVRAVAASQHDHVRRPPAGRPAAAAVCLVGEAPRIAPAKPDRLVLAPRRVASCRRRSANGLRYAFSWADDPNRLGMPT